MTKVILWNRLTDEWREEVAEASCVPLEVMGQPSGSTMYAAVTLRYGTFGRADHSTHRDDEEAPAVLLKLANKLGGRDTQQLSFEEGNRAKASKADGKPAWFQTNTPCGLRWMLMQYRQVRRCLRACAARYASAEDHGVFQW